MSRLRRPFRSQLTAPPTLIEEVDRELDEAVSDLVHLAERLSLLAELQQVAVRAELRLGRPVTVFDIFDAARTEADQRRLDRLVRCLRGDG